MPTYLIIPNATDQISQSQLQIQTNFASIKALIDVNHVGFADGVNFGKHDFIEFPVQSPVPTTVGAEVGLYSQQSTLTSQPELVFARQMGSTVPNPVLLTTEFTSAAWTNPGWTKIPSGILVKWGSFTANGNTNTTINFPVAASVPVFTDVLNIQLTVSNPASGSPNQVVMLTNNTTTTLTVFLRQLIGGATNAVVFYLAIGF